MKKDLDRIFKAKGTTGNPEFSMSQESRSSRGSPAKQTIYYRICIFCNKESKYAKGQQTREKLIQCSDLRSDQRIRDVATARHDTNILAIASRELVEPRCVSISPVTEITIAQWVNVSLVLAQRMTRSTMTSSPRPIKNCLIISDEIYQVTLKTEFKSLLQFEDFLGNNRLFLFPGELITNSAG